MNTQYDIMKVLLDNPNAQGIAQLIHSVVLPAIAKMPADQQIEAMGTVRDAVSDIAEYEECRKHMTETIKGQREKIEDMREALKNTLPPWEANNYKKFYPDF